jgi:hypothetical protein
MIITQSTVLQSASHHSEVRENRSESLQHYRIGADGSTEMLAQQSRQQGSVTLSEHALALSRTLEIDQPDTANAFANGITHGATPATPETSSPADSTSAMTPQEGRLRLLAALLSSLTGKKIELFDTRALERALAGERTAPASFTTTSPPGADQTSLASGTEGMRYEYHAERVEFEQTRFSAQGVIHTQDGVRINVDVQMEMSRHFSERESLVITAGAQLKDPLVINYDAPAVTLTAEKFAFDLDNDGRREQISTLGTGSGFLVWDKNGNGQADNGSELLGALTGNGFAELARFDEDGNGFIDAGDSIYDALSVWIRPGSNDEDYLTLTEADVGAIYLGTVATPFEIRNENNALLGKVRDSSIFISEAGDTGTVQQIDLVV